jgi:hypothetical protein
MERDMDLVRELLIAVERDQRLDGPDTLDFESASEFGLESYPDAKVAYHLRLLIDARFLDGEVPDEDLPGITVRRLTWEGHEFLDNIPRRGHLEKDQGTTGRARASFGSGWLYFPRSHRPRSRNTSDCP